MKCISFTTADLPQRVLARLVILGQSCSSLLSLLPSSFSTRNAQLCPNWLLFIDQLSFCTEVNADLLSLLDMLACSFEASY